MKNCLLLFSFFVLFSCSSTQNKLANSKSDITVLSFDSTQISDFGADDYGMKQYVIAFLKKGPNRDFEQSKADSLQMAHLENIGKMAEVGKLVLAGPFIEDGDLRGIYIFNVSTIEEAEALTNSDPAIQAGSLIMELKPWYGSAALMAVNEIHNVLSKKEITE